MKAAYVWLGSGQKVGHRPSEPGCERFEGGRKLSLRNKNKHMVWRGNRACVDVSDIERAQQISGMGSLR